MAEKTSLAKLKPLFFGRLTRVGFGVASLYWGVHLWGNSFDSILFSSVVLFLGLSFLVGGLIANPGCEVTAPFNLFLPLEKRSYSLCPLWTPLDRAEHWMRKK